MNLIATMVMAIVFAVSCGTAKSSGHYYGFGLKPRIVVLTDIAPGDLEPDDMESMVRLMAHADLYEIEALITSGGWNSSNIVYPVDWKDSLSTTIDALRKIFRI